MHQHGKILISMFQGEVRARNLSLKARSRRDCILKHNTGPNKPESFQSGIWTGRLLS